VKTLMQQADTNGGQGAAVAAGAAAGAGAAGGAAAGAAGGAGTGAQGQGQQQGQQGSGAGTQAAAGKAGEAAGTNTNDGKGTGDTSQVTPASFVPKLPGDKKHDSDPVLKEYFGKFNAIFADDSLSTTGKMQKLVDLQVEHAAKVQQANAAKEQEHNDRIAAQPAQDLEKLKADKTFGGPNFQATVDSAKRIEAYAFGEELGKLLAPYGMQSDPVLLKGFARLARVISEDAIGGNTGNNSQQVDELAALFPNSIDSMRKSARR
jgi:hypothetical protein